MDSNKAVENLIAQHINNSVPDLYLYQDELGFWHWNFRCLESEEAFVSVGLAVADFINDNICLTDRLYDKMQNLNIDGRLPDLNDRFS